MLNRYARCLALTAFVGCLLMMTGCSNKGGSDKTYTRKGQVKSIDLANRKVVLSFMKGSETRELKGSYTDETVVIVNGRNMSVKEIKEGDKVEVVGRKEGSGTDAQFIATRVTVTRNDGDWQETGKSAKSKADDKTTAKSDTDS